MQIEWKQLLFTFSGHRIPLHDGQKKEKCHWKNMKKSENMDLVKIYAMDHTVGWYKLVQLHRFATITIYRPPARRTWRASCISWWKGGVLKEWTCWKQKHMNKFVFQPFMQQQTKRQGFSEILSQNKAPIHNKILLWTPVWDYVLQKLQKLLKKCR